MQKIIECIPNFSEGRNQEIIDSIASEIEKIEHVKLLAVEPGYSANRTVMTFIGSPEKVQEAAFNAIARAVTLIDMSKHEGVHPCIGACDVCPFVPVSGISMNETVLLSRQLAEKVAKELHIPVYCYENAAFLDNRKRLENIRKGGYQGLKEKISLPEWKPDFGPQLFIPSAGASVIGARDFLIAFNINLETPDLSIAENIAASLRKIRKENSSFQALKAIGWYIPEYKHTQVSINFTDYKLTPLFLVYEKVKELALHSGTVVTGSELIGFIPRQALIEAGIFYSNNKNLTREALIGIAASKLGITHFSQDKVLETSILNSESEIS